MSDPVVVVGAGLSGLVAAARLHEQGVGVRLLEASDGLGGRVRSDEVDGFLLDRGFQVLLTAYPEAERELDYKSLDLRSFDPGSLIRKGNGLETLSDPWRAPRQAFRTAFARVGSLMDKLRIGQLRAASCRGNLEDIFSRPDRSTKEELRSLGFSEEMVEQFFRPFLGGVFLDSELETSCRMLYFVFRMFSLGDTALPAGGMGAIPKQLAARLPEDSISLRASVDSIEQDHVRMVSGEQVAFSRLLVAADQTAAAKLLPELATERKSRSVWCVYFSAPEPAVKDKMLVLNGTGSGLVNNLCFPSQIAPGYAPAGRTLVSATVLRSDVSDDLLSGKVQSELRDWFGNAVDDWTHLRTYNIAHALPNQATPAFDPPVIASKLRDKIHVCGDYRANGSINGAMQSGRLAADEILRELS